MLRITRNKNLRVMAIFYLVMGLVMGFAAPLIPSLVIDVGLTFTELGGASSLAALLAGLGLPVLGYLGDKYGKKKMLILATGIRISALAIFAATMDRELILLAYMLNELGFILYLPFARAVVSEAAGKEEMGRAYGELITIVSFTEVVAPLISGQIYRFVQDYNAMFLPLFLASVGATPILLLLDEVKAEKPIHPREILRLSKMERRVYIPAILEAVAWRVWIFLLYTAPKDRLGIGPDFIGIAYTAQSGAWFLTQYVAGHLTDRVGAKKMYIVSDSLMIPMALLYIFYMSEATVLINAALFGLSISLWIPAFNRVVFEASTQETRALTYSKVDSFRYLASTPAAQIGGMMYEGLDPASPFILGIALVAIDIYLEYRLFPDV